MSPIRAVTDDSERGLWSSQRPWVLIDTRGPPVVAMVRWLRAVQAAIAKNVSLFSFSIRSVMQKYLEERNEITFDKIFNQKIGKSRLGIQRLRLHR